MKVEVVSPEEYLGDVIGDLNSRRGQIQGTDSRGNAQTVDALVPLANMFGYVTQLRSFTQGRAQYSMQFSHYDDVPQNVADAGKDKLASFAEPGWDGMMVKTELWGPVGAAPRAARVCNRQK